MFLASSKKKHNIGIIIGVVFVVIALIITLVALFEKPDKDDRQTPSDPSSSSSETKINALSDVTTEVSYTDMDGNLSINEVTKLLIKDFILNASSDKTTFKITSASDASFAVIDKSMDYSSICKGPLTDTVWFVSGKAVVKYKGELVTDSDGYAFTGGRYIVKSGNTYTMVAQSVYEAKQSEPTQGDPTPSDPGTTEPSIPSTPIETFTWGTYDTSVTIASSEMYLSCGVHLADTYESVEKAMNGFDSTEESTDHRTKTASKASYTFTFTLIDAQSNSATDFGIAHDGKYHLTFVSADETCSDEFPRGIKIGDTLDNVLTKFPSAIKKYKDWADDRIYGAYEDTHAIGVKYAWLQYGSYTGAYTIHAKDTGREQINICFDKGQKVIGFEWELQK